MMKQTIDDEGEGVWPVMTSPNVKNYLEDILDLPILFLKVYRFRRLIFE